MSIKTAEDFRGLAKVGKIVGLVLRKLTERLQVGMTTLELDEIGARLLKSHAARPAPKFIYGFPGSILISLNDEAVHGIPTDRQIKPGDLVKIDVTAEHHGYIADAASTIALAPTSSLTRRLAVCARAAFRKGLRAARSGRPLSDIGKAVETQVTRNGFRVIRELHGHGWGGLFMRSRPCTISTPPQQPNASRKASCSLSSPSSPPVQGKRPRALMAGRSRLLMDAPRLTTSTPS